jgi:hypothetical protein
MNPLSWLSHFTTRPARRQEKPISRRRRRTLRGSLQYLEDRRMLASATLDSGVLSVDFLATDATAESITVSNDGVSISVSGSIAGGSANFVAANVQRIVARDVGGGGNQSLSLGGAAPFSLSGGLATSGLETVNVNNTVSSSTAAIDIVANNIAIGASGFLSTTGTVVLSGPAGREISIGVEQSSRTSFTDAELDQITAGLVQIGHSGFTRGIFVTGAITHNNHLAIVNNVSASSSSGIVFEAGITMAADKNLSVTALGGPRPIESFNTSVISTSGSGTITMTANSGITLRPGTTITTENGDLSLVANAAGTDTGLYSGVFLAGGIVETRGTGDVRLTGRGSLGTAGGTQVDGVRIIGQSIVRSTSSLNLPNQGEILIDGFGGRGAGVYIDPFGVAGDIIKSQSGNITITGQGGNLGNGGIQAYGVALGNGPRVVAANGASVSITGTAGIGGSSPGIGVGSGTVLAFSGNIALTGVGGTTTTGTFNSGIESTGGVFQSTNGTVSLTGTGGSSTGQDYGIYMYGTQVRSTNNAVTVTGSPGAGPSSFALWLDNHTPISGGVSVDAVGDSMNMPRSFFSNQFSSPLVTLRPYTANTRVNIGGGDSLTSSPRTLGLHDVELDLVSANTLRIGDNSTGVVTVVSAGTIAPTDQSRHIEIYSASDIVFNGSLETVGFFSAGGPTRGNLLLSPGPTAVVQPKSSANDIVTKANLGTAFTTSFAAGRDLGIQINGLTPHTQYDRLTAVGAINLSGADLKLAGSLTTTLGNSFVIVSATSIVGTFNGLPENGVAQLNGRALRANYTSTTVILTDIGPGNTAPTANNDSLLVLSNGGPVLLNPLANDTDLEGNIVPGLTTIVTPPAAGQLVAVGDGSFTFDPADDFNGLAPGQTATVEFTYRIEDSNGATDEAVFTLTVLGGYDTLVTLDASGNLQIVDVAGGVSNDQLTVTLAPRGGWYTIADQQLILYSTIAGTLGNGSSEVRVPAAAVASGRVVVETLGGNDQVTLDFSPAELSAAGRATAWGGLGSDQISFVFNPNQLDALTTDDITRLRSYLAAPTGVILAPVGPVVLGMYASEFEIGGIEARDDGQRHLITSCFAAIQTDQQIIVGSDSADDTLLGTSLTDLMFGQGGADRLEGASSSDCLFGGTGNDQLFGDYGFDSLVGGSGNDLLDGGLHDDWLDGGAGADQVFGGPGYDAIVARGDELIGDFLNGGDNVDRIVNVSTAPIIIDSFHAGTSSIEGWDGNNQPVLGTAGDDSINFLLSSFSSLSLSRVPYVDGGSGNDTITGTFGVDDLRGGAGDDTLLGMGGVDRLYGGSGDDSLNGGDGVDHLYGGDGDDVITTGSGRDIVYFESDLSGLDTLTDFALYSDTINLQAYGITYSQLQFTITGGVTTMQLPNGKRIRLLNWNRAVASSQIKF